MDLSKIKAILFDMDGTLTDTEPEGIKTLLNLSRNHRLELHDAQLSLFDKVWRRDGTDMEFEEYMNELAHLNNIENVESLIGEFFEKYESAIISAPILPGVQEFLNLAKNKFKLAVVTASTDKQAQAVIRQHGWESVFNLVLTQDTYKHKKPDSTCYLMAAELLNVSPEECLVVEDSKNGALSGKSAGMYVIGVLAGNEHPQDLSAANRIMTDLSQLSNILK